MSASGASSPSPPTGDPAAPPRSPGEMAKTVAADAAALVRAEIDLAKAEVMGGVRARALGAGLVAAAGALTGVAALALLVAAGFGLAEGLGLPGWASALIVAGALLLLALLLALVGRAKLSAPVTTEVARENVTTDVAFVRQRLKARS